MMFSTGWLFVMYLSPVLSLIPVMLLWQWLAAIAGIRDQL